MKPCKNSWRSIDKLGYHRYNQNGYYHYHRYLYAKKHKVELTRLDIVRHTCDNRWCVEITHLVLGNHSDNRQDNMKRQGHITPAAKLTEDQVREIRDTYKKGDITQYDLADWYGVHQRTISEIVRGVTWKHVE